MSKETVSKTPSKNRPHSLISFLGSFVSIWAITCTIPGSENLARADDPNPEIVIASKKKTTSEQIKESLRFRSFTEFMTPAFDNHGNYVPYEDGSKLTPTNAFNIIWVDYEIAKDLKVLYWQRSTTSFASTPSAENFSFVLRNPRFGLRKLNVFNVPNLTTTYDIYVQPGLASEANLAGRNMEFGFRTATSYAFPRSNWTIGATTEFTGAISTAPSGPAGTSNIYGWALPWASYSLSKIFSTQHYMTVSFRHARGISGLLPDYPMPFNIQNGIGAAVSEQIWVAAFINNYLNTPPTLANTWVSLWLNLTVL